MTRIGLLVVAPLALLGVSAAATIGCSKKTGVVPKGPHLVEQEGEPVRVRRPPPPVRVEAIPLRRNKECFYIDGAWVPDGSSWQWEKGRWVLAPLACYYAPPVTRYEEFDFGTALVFRPGVWHSPSGADCPDARACPAPKGK